MNEEELKKWEAKCENCKEIIEIYCGMEGFDPVTAPEAYLLNIIDRLRIGGRFNAAYTLLAAAAVYIVET